MPAKKKSYVRATKTLPGQLNGQYVYAFRTPEKKVILALKKYAKDERRTVNNLLQKIVEEALKAEGYM
tara:strand:+ start:3785 stop:3988 length:204 start_codon:yes stop_codon:yes gene_type:complete